MRLLHAGIAMVSLLLRATCQEPTPPRYDLVLRGGQLIDGTKAPAVTGDLAITAGRIAALGTFPIPAGTPVLPVTGLQVAPGFLDVHTHVDADVVREPLCSNFLRMGVTTIVTGNCGGSVL